MFQKINGRLIKYGFKTIKKKYNKKTLFLNIIIKLKLIHITKKNSLN